MKYPIRREFKLFSPIRMPVNPVAVKLAYYVMPYIQRGKKLDKSLEKMTIQRPGYKADLILPKDVSNPPLLVYIHGGGFILGAASYHKNLAQTYAKEASCAVLFVDYRLAPKYKFPIPLSDCFDAYRWALKQASYGKVIVGGDSAGASLSLGVLQLAHQEGVPMADGLMLVYPLCDTRMITESMKKYPDTPLWNSTQNPKALKLYADEADLHDPLISAVEAEDLSFLPPTYIETAQYDCLHDEGILLAEKLKAEGVPVTLNETEDTMHGYDIAEFSPYVKKQVQKRIEFLKSNFNS